MITKFETEVYERLYQNSIVFLKDGLERLVNKDDGDEDYIEHDLLTLTCASFQISIELAIKALIVEREGIKYILPRKEQTLSQSEIETLYQDNRLKTLEFDAQKNFIKSKNYIQDLNKYDFETIDEFQIYRNRIVHFTYRFQDGDLFDLKYDLIYYLIHIIIKILLSNRHQDEKPSEFLQYKLGNELHQKLINYAPYVQAMQNLAKINSEKVFECIVCNNRTYRPDEEYCYCCNFEGEAFTPINCDYCDEKRSVIYDNLNIDINGNEARGLCLNCGNDAIIYECPKCRIAYNIETNFGDYCTKGKCVNE